jgi:FlaG/FlaF family flagellin (archaellin)
LDNRAASDVIAALLLIATAISAAVLMYVFAIGLLGNIGATGGQQISEQLMLEAYSWSPGVITGSFRNVGSSSIGLGAADI